MSEFSQVWEMISSARFLSALLVAWIVTPGLFVLIGVIFEGRMVPLWHHQARSFMPGDLLLGVVMAVGWYFYLDVDSSSLWKSHWLWVGALGAGFVLAYLAHRFLEGPNYPASALSSPTKLYHDFVLYGIYGPVLALIAIPAVFATPLTDHNASQKMLALVCFVGWISMLVWDNEHLTSEDRQHMHPADWKK